MEENDDNSENEELVQQNDSTIILQTLRIYGTVYLVSMLAFSILRRCAPRLYSVRSWVPELRCQLAVTQNAKTTMLFSWFWRVLEATDLELFEQCGMDALCFVRAMRFGRNLGIIGSVNALWLIPLYATARDSPETNYLTDKLVIITLAHLPNDSPRYVGTLVAMYINFFFAMYLVLQEMRWYTIWRHRFLTQKQARNYAVYVAGIPEEWRSTRDLIQYFQNCTSARAVLEAHVALDVPNLEKRQEKRNALILKMEHIHAKDKRSGRETTHHRIVGIQNGLFDRVSTKNHLEMELDGLNKGIAVDIRKALIKSDRAISTPSRMGSSRNLLRGQDQQQQDDNQDTSRKRVLRFLDETAETSLPNQNGTKMALDDTGDRVIVRSASDCDLGHGRGLVRSASDGDLIGKGNNNNAKSGPYSRPRKVLAVGAEKVSQSLTSTITTSSHVARSTIKRGGQAATGAIKLVKDAQVDKYIKSAAEGGAMGVRRVGSELVSSASAVVPILRLKGEGAPRDAGFVVFRRLYAVQSVLQMIHDDRPYVMDCFEAPEPGDIFWRNVGLSAEARRVGLLLSMAATVTTCIFWSVPMSLLASLTEVNSLKETLPKLGRLIEENPSLEAVLVQLAPLILLIMNEIFLPMILKYSSRWEGSISAAMLEASLFLKLGVFMIVQTFFVSAISGGISAELSNMISNPELIIDLLANSLPAQSTYFVQIILTTTCILQAFEMLRVYPLTVSLLRRCFGPRLTAKQRRQTWFWFNSLEQPPEFWHAETFAQLILLFMVFFVYAVIAPFTSFVVMVCFIVLESGYRYQFIHNYPRAFDTGGKIWYYFLEFILACMIVAQLTLIGLMALKQSPYASPVLLPLLALTCLFIVFVNSRHATVTRHLPTRQCIEEDGRSLLEDEEIGDEKDFSFVEGAYLQPALKHRHATPEYDDDDVEASSQ